MRLRIRVRVAQEQSPRKKWVDEMRELVGERRHGRRVPEGDDEVRAKYLNNPPRLFLSVDDDDWIEAPAPHRVVEAHRPTEGGEISVRNRPTDSQRPIAD